MPPPTPTLPLTLTLIVAATSRTMGIGLHGHLPWPSLKQEMAYFARVTKHPPPSPPFPPTTSANPTSPSPPPHLSPSSTTKTRTLNALLMGHKTYTSIPPRFRPLAGRINVVISRTPDAIDLEAERTRSQKEGTQGQKDGTQTPVFAAGGIHEALETLRARYGEGTGEEGGGTVRLGHVFVIGGAEIYEAAMGMRETRRVLLTRVRGEFECDRFFPVGLGVGGGDGDGDGDGDRGHGEGGEGWVKRGRKALREFVGGKEGIVPEGVVREGDVEWEVELWEREG